MLQTIPPQTTPPQTPRQPNPATRRPTLGRSGLRFGSVSLLVVLATVALPATVAASPEDVNRIVLRVNEEILTLHEFEVRKASEVNTILGNPNLGPSERQERLGSVAPNLMQQMFREMLLLSRAKQLGMRVDEAEVDAAVDDIVARQGMSSRQELLAALSQAGIEYEAWRETIRRDLLWSQVIGREVTGKMEVGEEELRAYYKSHEDEFRVSEERRLWEVIVKDTSGLDAAGQLEIAEEIRRAVDGGISLADAVVAHEGAGVTTGLIDLGWLERSELEDSLGDAAFALASPGDISQPIEARGGYHILQLADVKPAKEVPYADVEDQIAGRVRASRFDAELRTYLAKLEGVAYIQEDVPPEAAGYRSLGDFVLEDELEMFRRPTPAQTDDEGEGATPSDEGAAGTAPTGSGEERR